TATGSVRPSVRWNTRVMALVMARSIAQSLRHDHLVERAAAAIGDAHAYRNDARIEREPDVDRGVVPVEARAAQAQRLDGAGLGRHLLLAVHAPRHVV